MSTARRPAWCVRDYDGDRGSHHGGARPTAEDVSIALVRSDAQGASHLYVAACARHGAMAFLLPEDAKGTAAILACPSHAERAALITQSARTGAGTELT